MATERMSDRVRDVGDGLILAFPIETTEVAREDIDTVRMYFLRVSRQTRYFERYTALSAIGSGSTSPTNGFDYLGATGVGSGADVFRQETDDWHLTQFGVGTEHPDLQVFYAVSPKADGNAAIDRTGTDEDIAPGTDDRGWFTSAQMANHFDPPGFTERVSFRNDKDGEFLQWAFYNDGGAQLSGADLYLYLVGRAYKVQPVTNRAMQDTMLEMALRRPNEPEIDTVIHQVGGVNTFTLGAEEPDSWGDVNFDREFNVDQLTRGQEPSARA